MTVGAIMALNEANVQIPQQLSVISFDEIELVKAVKPRLTTVNQQTALIAEEAVKCIISGISGASQPQRVHLVPTVLVERDSVERRL